jgi:putative restriction endonuclease
MTLPLKGIERDIRLLCTWMRRTMALSDLTERSAVVQAIAEYDALGRERFLEKYGFGPARRFYLRHSGRLYDSKAVVGAAHGFQHPAEGPLRAADFSGGDATERRKLEDLGFSVEVVDAGEEQPASEHLVQGRLYTRADIREQFAIIDATIDTGVFRPRGFSSVWLFVTEEKTSDRTQYRDHLDGDVLHWEGQTSGRTDPTIIEHRRRGFELLLFHRKSRREYPGGAFRYEGPFEYVRPIFDTTIREGSPFQALTARATGLSTTGGRVRRACRRAGKRRRAGSAAARREASGTVCQPCPWSGCAG